jgi:DNA replicative helicase MCM subunit Mcm2 (Cdc46/Mcm family)
MENQKRKEVIYSLCIEDIQTVAELEIERELTIEEINNIKDLISEKIDWYEAIANSIAEEIVVLV